MLSIAFARFAMCEPTYNYDEKTSTLKITGDGEISADVISEMFPEGRNWTTLIVDGNFPDIRSGVFSGANSMTSMTLPDSVERIHNYAFTSLWKLENLVIPKGVQSVGKRAFQDSKGIKTVTYYKRCVFFGDRAFQDCENLVSFKLAENDPTVANESATKCFGAGVFWNCPLLTEMQLNPLTTIIGKELFNGCETLESIVLPPSITYISDRCFVGCSALKTIDLKNIKTIGESAFSACLSLASLDVSDKLTFIGRSAFASSGLSDLSALSKIAYEFDIAAFEAIQITKFTLPSKMEFIPDYSFTQCNKMTEIELHENVNRIGRSAFFNCSFVSFKLPKKLSSIEDGAFVANKFLKNFDIDKDNKFFGVDEGNSFLYRKEDMTIIFYPQANEKESILIPKEYKRIGFGAFSWCTKIASIRFEGELEDIGQQAFAHCLSLSGKITLPNSLLIINDKCFLKCIKLNEVVIGENTTSLCQECFSGCTALAVVSIGPNLFNCGERCFSGCRNLKKLDLKNARFFETYCFSGCSSLSQVIVSDLCKGFAKGIFSYCSSLTSFTLPKQITHIHDYCFNNAGLKTITLPESVKVIDDHAFNGTKLQTIVFPASVSVVSSFVLGFIPTLTSVTFMGELNTVGESFIFKSGAPNLHVEFKQDCEQISNSAFSGVSNLRYVTYCGKKALTSSFLQEIAPPPTVTVGIYYSENQFGGVKVEKKLEACPPLRTNAPTLDPTPPPLTPIATPVNTQKPSEYQGWPKRYIVLTVMGSVLLVSIIAAVFIVRCCMKHHGWAKKETLTESLLTQTV